MKQRHPAASATFKAEESVVGAVLVHGDLIKTVSPILKPADIDHPALRAIYQAMLELNAARYPIDLITVEVQLGKTQTADQLQILGGIKYLHDVQKQGMDVFNVGYHARLVAEAAAHRRLLEVAREIERGVAAGEDPTEVRDSARARIESTVRSAGGADRLVSPAARARAVGGAQRIASGFETFDANTRGGPRVGKRIVIGGAPGAGKTTWLVQMLWEWARQGVSVLLLCFDEEAEDILIRIGQLNGLEREDLERGDDEARRALADLLEATPSFMLLDGDEDDVTVEAASAELQRRRGNGQLSVLGVDSIQTARVVGDASAETSKARVDMVMAALKRAGKVDKHLVIATCELSRGGYRSQNAAERVDDLAAFKESGGIEYGASMALVMRSVKDAEGTVDVAVPKNRMGTKKTFRLQLDFRQAAMREVTQPSPAEEEAVASPMQKAKEKLITVLEKTIQPITSASELARRAKVSKATALKAVKELVEDGRLSRRGEEFVPVPVGSGTGSEPAAVGHGSTVPSPLGEPGTGTASRNRSDDDDA